MEPNLPPNNIVVITNAQKSGGATLVPSKDSAKRYGSLHKTFVRSETKLSTILEPESIVWCAQINLRSIY